MDTMRHNFPPLLRPHQMGEASNHVSVNQVVSKLPSRANAWGLRKILGQTGATKVL